jgi:DNA-binding transcriptional LysR family regulator
MADLRGVDLNLLVILDAVLTERSLTRAAEAIGSTQPAVSAAMAKLRRLLDDPLLVRSGNGSVLTARAEAVAPVAREALAAVGRTLDARPAFDPRTSERQFLLTASDYALAVMTAPLLDLLKSEAPGISIEFSPLSVFEPVDLLRVDVAVASAARGVPGKRLSLFSDSMTCVVREGHPHAEGFTLADLEDVPYVQVALGDRIVTAVDEALHTAGVFPHIARTVPGFLAVPFMVADSDMYGFVPARLAALYERDLGIRSIATPLTLPILVEAAFWHPSRTDDPALSWLVSTLRRVAERVEFPDQEA